MLVSIFLTGEIEAMVEEENWWYSKIAIEMPALGYSYQIKYPDC